MVRSDIRNPPILRIGAVDKETDERVGERRAATSLGVIEPCEAPPRARSSIGRTKSETARNAAPYRGF